MNQRFAVIMAGGSGERFWPLSRISTPKQLLNLAHEEKSLLVQAKDRLVPLFGERKIGISAGRAVEDALRQADLVAPANLFIEPHKRNTLGALCWVTANLIAQDRHDCTLAVVTADQFIPDTEGFVRTLEVALQIAEASGGLVTIGIKPTRPEVGYGYIELTNPVSHEPQKISAFREKPTAQDAELYVRSGKFLWNSGMFIWKLDSFLRELTIAQPEVAKVLHHMANEITRGNIDSAQSFFEQIPNISVDYALMEKSQDCYVVPAEFSWDDIGSWDALLRTLPRDDDGNAVVGDVVIIESKDSVIYNLTDKVVTGIGLVGHAVVVTPDAVCVLPLSYSQQIKQLLDELRRLGRDDLL